MKSKLSSNTTIKSKESQLLSQRQQETEAQGAKIAKLTRRKRDIIALVCEGLKDRQIAKRLSLSTSSVRVHLGSIFSKLGVSDRFELIIYAYIYGLALPPGEVDAQENEQAVGRAFEEST